MDYVKQEVFNLDGNTQLEFVCRKTIIIIDKDRFSICKQLMMEDAGDEEYSSFLNIPVEKVRYFKHKMQQFEESIRARRRSAKLEKRRKKPFKVPTAKKREISSEERFRRARDLISRSMSTNQISKILKVSERSVTRFKRRMREEKQRLKAEGKIDVDPNDPDDENSFRHLPPDDKIKTAKELFQKRLKIQEISEILKISERSVRRWKDKLSKLKDEPINEAENQHIKDELESMQTLSTRPVRIKREKVKHEFEDDDDDDDEENEETEETKAQPARKKRRLYVDREKVQYARELIDNKLSNKEMAMLLEMSIACVRKLKLKILNGTVEELIDNSEEHYTKLGRNKHEAIVSNRPDPDADPLHMLDSYATHTSAASTNSSFGYERKPKVVLRDREMYMVRLLRDNNIRTMDIAKMMKISERSVTRLLARSKDVAEIHFEDDIVAQVERLLADKDEILNSDIIEMEGNREEEASSSRSDESKRKLGHSLIAMNVKNKDIAKMLDVTEKTVQRWKSRLQNDREDSPAQDEKVHVKFLSAKKGNDEKDVCEVYEQLGEDE